MASLNETAETSRGMTTTLRDHLLYLVIVAAYCLPYLFQRDLFFRDESRYGAVVKDMIANDAWFTLTIGGEYYSEKPPLFFALVRLTGAVTGSDEPWVFFVVVALSALFFVAASDAFLRAAGYGRRMVLSANLLLLAVPWIAVHMQLVRMDLLFSGLILFSLACYVRGIDAGTANVRPLMGGFLAGLALLAKGPFGALIPLLSVLAYLAATRRLRRAFRADVLWSVVLALAPVAFWLVSLSVTFGRGIFDTIFGEQIMQRALSGRDSVRPFWLYPLWLAWTLMPWLLLLPVLFIARLRNAVFSGPDASPGLRLVLPMLAAAMVLLGLVAQKNIHYLLPLVPGLMVLVAIFYLRLDDAAPRLIDWFYIGVALVALIGPPLGVWALGFTPADTQSDIANYIRPATINHAAAALSLTAIPLAIAARLRGVGRLIAGVVAVMVMVIAVKAIVLPDLDRVYSPRHLANSFESRVPDGETILVYDVYWGSLSYHFGHPLTYIEDRADLADVLAGSSAPAYAIVPETAWTRQPDLWRGFEELDQGRLETKDLVLLGRTAKSE